MKITMIENGTAQSTADITMTEAIEMLREFQIENDGAEVEHKQYASDDHEFDHITYPGDMDYGRISAYATDENYADPEFIIIGENSEICDVERMGTLIYGQFFAVA